MSIETARRRSFNERRQQRIDQPSTTIVEASFNLPFGVSEALAWAMTTSGCRCSCRNYTDTGGPHLFVGATPFTTSLGITPSPRLDCQRDGGQPNPLVTSNQKAQFSHRMEPAARD